MFSIENTALIEIDIQQKLFNVIYEKEILAANNVKLIKGLNALEIPTIITEQNPAGLGPTIEDISSLVPDAVPVVKFAFSCCKEPAFMEVLDTLRRKNRNQLLITGIETHICVYQTAIELFHSDFEVQIVKDCVSSRTPENRDAALARMESEGIKITTTEMILFELLETAKHEKFKEISSIIK